MFNTHIRIGHPRRNIPRHQIWKYGNIYECRACGKMYTDLMVDSHTKSCTKMEEFVASGSQINTTITSRGEIMEQLGLDINKDDVEVCLIRTND